MKIVLKQQHKFQISFEVMSRYLELDGCYNIRQYSGVVKFSSSNAGEEINLFDFELFNWWLRNNTLFIQAFEENSILQQVLCPFKVVELPDDIKEYYIQSDDLGKEIVHECHRSFS